MTPDRHVLVVEARYYEDIADQLAAGAIAVFDRGGIGFTRLAVPGAFELPAAIAYALAAAEAGSGRAFDGFLALGCVILGETDHYDHICRETSRGLMSLTIDRRLALGFGLLTCRTYEQARVRAAVDGKNKGAEAARACVGMMELRERLGLSPR
ncbi:MAG: 6,7-dimethyl-8-ribityllumazine synthase [Rhodospirillales bacterium]